MKKSSFFSTLKRLAQMMSAENFLKWVTFLRLQKVPKELK